MEQVQQVFAAFGSQTELARLTEIPLTTVNGWRSKGVPHWRRRTVLEAAAKLPEPLPAAVVEYLSAAA